MGGIRLGAKGFRKGDTVTRERAEDKGEETGRRGDVEAWGEGENVGQE